MGKAPWECIHPLEDRLARRIGRRGLFRFFRFEPLDRRPEPGAQRFFKLLVGSGAIQRIESLSVRRQWNMRAWNLFLARTLRDELHQQAFLTRFAILGIKVHAGGRILKNKSWPPSFARQSSVTALLKELQLELQHIQQVAIILCHKLTVYQSPSISQHDAVTGITVWGESHHAPDYRHEWKALVDSPLVCGSAGADGRRQTILIISFPTALPTNKKL